MEVRMFGRKKTNNDKSFIQNRRNVLRMGVGTAIGALTARAASAVTATPTATEGPFWIDEKLNRVDVRSNTATATVNPGVAQAGFPLHLTVNFSTLVNNVSTPSKGVYIDIWHANAQGSYSDESNVTTINESYTVGQNFLRGYQITDAHGNARFLTNYPAYYNGRCPHIHVRVRRYSGTTVTTNFTTQLFFNETVTTYVYAYPTAATSPYATSTTRTMNANDMVYTGITGGGSVMLATLSNDKTYAIGSYNIVLA
jgi:protocatechuate 3,4-dioxygenase beta subunit